MNYRQITILAAMFAALASALPAREFEPGTGLTGRQWTERYEACKQATERREMLDRTREAVRDTGALEVVHNAASAHVEHQERVNCGVREVVTREFTVERAERPERPERVERPERPEREIRTRGGD